MRTSLATICTPNSRSPAVPPVIECRTFGAFSVISGGISADTGGPKQRLLLALLLCRAGSVVGVGELIDALWRIPHLVRPGRTCRCTSANCAGFLATD